MNFYLFFRQIFQNCSIFEPFLFLCLFGNFCKYGVHSYQFYHVQSTSSPILKPLVYWGHLVWGKFPLCYFKATIYLHTNRVFLCRLFLNLVGTYFEYFGVHCVLNVSYFGVHCVLNVPYFGVYWGSLSSTLQRILRYFEFQVSTYIKVLWSCLRLKWL